MEQPLSFRILLTYPLVRERLFYLKRCSFEQRFYEKKQLRDLTEAAEDYEWYTSSILLKDKKYKDHKLVLNLKQFNESNE